MATYLLDNGVSRSVEARRSSRRTVNPELILSARWYTKVRWIAAAVFALVAALFSAPIGFGSLVGVLPIARPMWFLAAFLAVANIPFFLAARRTGEDASLRAIRTMLWGQIAVDLLSVTYLVHIVGSVDTFVSFFYLLHITLSCIALSATESLLVALASAMLYLGTVAAEVSGVVPFHPILAMGTSPLREDTPFALLFAISAVFLWFVIWYFISTLSRSLRRREEELRVANLRLEEASEEKSRIMLQTTHDLKTPFFGIESNLQLLREGVWENLPESARRTIERIGSQSKILRTRIDSILLYNELRSHNRAQRELPEAVDLGELIVQVLEEVGPRASQRRVSIESHPKPIVVRGSGRQLSILFVNLLSNAVAYSYEGGRIEVTMNEDDATAIVSVRDEGIGIRAEVLPHIFDEYFRTTEAVRMNKISSGLGLSIVREIALHNSLTIRVTTTEGAGTTFQVTIPKSGPAEPNRKGA